MKARPVTPFLLHIAATVLISLGFVKAAEKFDPLSEVSVDLQNPTNEVCIIGSLPCGSNKKL
ncbi:MAG: hypothetical protein R6V45_09480 [Oceanipulchritudo sp.]